MPDPILTSFETAKRIKRKSLEEQGIITKVPTDIIFADEVTDGENKAEEENNNKTDNKEYKEFTTKTTDNQIISDKDKKRIEMLKKCSGISDNDAIAYIEYMKTNRNKAFENLGDLSDENIKKSSDDIFNKLNKYNSDITKKLLNYEPIGQGKGEWFLEFIYDDAVSLGGQQSYDVSCDNGKHFEVKCYASDSVGIRLGTEGTVSRSKGYMNFITLMISINKLVSLNETEMTILMSMISNVQSKLGNDNDNLKEFMTNLFTTKSGENYYFKLMKGEFNTTDIGRMSNIIDVVKFICDEIYNNKFEFAKLIKENKMYVTKLDEEGKPLINQTNDTVYIECVTTDVTDEENVKKYILDIRDTIGGCYSQFGIKYESENAGKEYMDKFLSISEEEINKEFDQYHPMILINSTFTNPIVHGVFRKFKINVITQSGFKVIPDTGKIKSKKETKDSKDKLVKKMVKNKKK